MATEDRLTIDRLNEKGCFNLLCAMVKYMSREFRAAYAEHLKHPMDPTAYVQYHRIKDEFRSERFRTLTRLDGDRVVRKLEAIVTRYADECV